ncbi:hypothetical protein [Candidatus Methanodesulfokora washburnensis]|uniref:Uncharacterized protein n=1 Tax=Candidatus Methanodesulfokora washburnensis TaxID=2478471 RepID=A0A429GKK1_9CREN|nr:hypothetical protein [Candidatus Methanodesulfokores washburnensis]RSN74366.1 hypothetical protein D6D85_08335 [Candidatus Methanodesulfokores washburnensis]
MRKSSRAIAIMSMSNLLVVPLRFLAKVFLSYSDFSASELFLSLFLILIWTSGALVIWGID